jgi:hypothetical protein
VSEKCYRKGCVRLATREVDGVKSCGYHDPSHLKARADKRDAEQRADRARRSERDAHYAEVAAELSELLGVGVTAATTNFYQYVISGHAAEELLARLKEARDAQV